MVTPATSPAPHFLPPPTTPPTPTFPSAPAPATATSERSSIVASLRPIPLCHPLDETAPQVVTTRLAVSGGSGLPKRWFGAPRSELSHPGGWLAGMEPADLTVARLSARLLGLAPRRLLLASGLSVRQVDRPLPSSRPLPLPAPLYRVPPARP